MPKVTFQEYRPGRWVKLVDGKAVGPATDEEVAGWKREVASQSRIWQDVVRQATGPQAKRQRPPGRDATDANGAEIWRDVVSQTRSKPSRRGGPIGKPEPEPPPATIEDALLAARRGKPVVVRRGKVIAPGTRRPKASPTGTTPETASRAEPGRAEIAPTEKAAEPEKAQIPQTRDSSLIGQDRAQSPTDQTSPVPRHEEPPSPAPSKPKRKRRPRPRRAAFKQDAADSQPASVEEAVPVDEIASPAPQPPERVLEQDAAQPSSAGGRAEEAAIASTPVSVAEAVAPLLPEEAGSVKQESASSAARPGEKSSAGRPRKRAVMQATSPPAAAQSTEPSYLWLMASPGEDLAAVVRSGLAKYAQRFAEDAGAVLCHETDLALLDAAALPVDVRHRQGVPPRSVWIGPR